MLHNTKKLSHPGIDEFRKGCAYAYRTEFWGGHIVGLKCANNMEVASGMHLLQGKRSRYRR